MTIRLAEQADLLPLSELAKRTYSEAFRASFAPSDLEAHLKRHLSVSSFEVILSQDKVLLAEDEHQIVGYIQYGDARIPEARPSGDKEIYRLYVLSGFQNKRISSSLMEIALSELSGAERIFLDVWEKNSGAIRFYRRYGFETIGKRPFQTASGIKTGFDLVMVRTSNRL